MIRRAARGSVASPRSGFVKSPATDEGFQFGQGLGGVLPLDMDGQFAAGAGGQHHQRQHALATHLLTVFFHQNVAAKLIRSFDKQGGRPGVETQLVSNPKIFFHGGHRLNSLLRAHLHNSLIKRISVHCQISLSPVAIPVSRWELEMRRAAPFASPLTGRRGSGTVLVHDAGNEDDGEKLFGRSVVGGGDVARIGSGTDGRGR